jgi:hypothetical protein
MDLTTKLVKAILSLDYIERHERITEVIADCLADELFKMKSLFEKIKKEGGVVGDEDQKKYKDLEAAIAILDEHQDVTMKLIRDAQRR